MSDEELLARFRQERDNQWLGHLLERYTLLLLGVAMKYLKDKEQAHDAVQQIFLKALIHLPTGEIQNFKGWIYVLMRNHCLQLLRDKTYKASEEVLSQVAASPEGKEEIRQKEYTLDQMEEAMMELSDDQRQAITMFYLNKLSYQEIIDRTGYSFMQVKSYIQNGKRNLKLILLRKLGGRQS
jgi:RNA polymerase sigma-70 factor (ECF subfamily)